MQHHTSFHAKTVFCEYVQRQDCLLQGQAQLDQRVVFCFSTRKLPLLDMGGGGAPGTPRLKSTFDVVMTPTCIEINNCTVHFYVPDELLSDLNS